MATKDTTMPIDLIDPPELHKAATHAQVAVATGRRMIFLAGQVGQDANGNLAADLAGQTEQAVVNVAAALSAAGATFADVAKITIYAARWKPESMGAFVEGWQRAAARLSLGNHRPPTTFIGVEVLFTPNILIEFDVTAVAG
jgi:enamine deaminase RidA (YjgF/YER057c/UK114 family)